MQGHSLSRIDRRLLRQRSSRGLELHIQSRTHLQQSTPRLHRSMARPTRSRTRNLSLGPLVQHKPPTPRPGRNHTATSRKPTHNNTKESGLTIPTQNPGLDTSRGLRAYQGVNAQVQGFPCEQHSTTDTTAPKTQTTSPTTPRFSTFLAEVVCTLGTTPPQTVISPSPNGGIARHEAPTRRRHTDSQPLMLQNPHRSQHGGRRRSRRAWPRHPWAAGPGLPQKSHAIRLGEDSTRPKNVAISTL